MADHLTPDEIEALRLRVLASRDAAIVTTRAPQDDQSTATWSVRSVTANSNERVLSDADVLALIRDAAYHRARCEVLEMQLAHYRERGKAA